MTNRLFSIFQFILVFSLVCVPGVGHAEEDADDAATSTPDYKVTVSAGVNYLSGDYGQPVDTSIIYAPAILKVKRDAWTAKLTVPYIEITGPGVVVGGDDGATQAGAPVAKSTQSGLGDVIASLRYKQKLNKKGTSASLTGKVKLPTADEDKRLGTGKTDYIVEVGLSQVVKKTYFTGKVGRKFAGTSARYNIDDTWRFSVGAGYKLTDKSNVGAIYSFREASSSTGTNHSKVLGYVTYKLTDHVSAQVYAATGFTDGSPDQLVGTLLSYTF